MGWIHVQDNPGSNNLTSPTNTGSSFSVGPFPNPVTVGNIVIVGVTGLDNSKSVLATDITCTDNGSPINTYTQLAFFREANGDQDGWIALFATKVANNPIGSHLNPTINILNGKTSIVNLGAVEFSGGTTVLDGSILTSEEDFIFPFSPTTFNFSLSTTVANDLLIGMFADNRGGSYTWTPPAGFLTCGTQSNGNSFLPGQFAYRIVSGTLNAQLLSWGNAGATQDGTACILIAALEPAGTINAGFALDPTFSGSGIYPGEMCFRFILTDQNTGSPLSGTVALSIDGGAPLPSQTLNSAGQVTFLVNNILPANSLHTLVAKWTGSGQSANSNAISFAVMGFLPTIQIVSISGSTISAKVTAGTFQNIGFLTISSGQNAVNNPTYIGQSNPPNVTVFADLSTAAVASQMSQCAWTCISLLPSALSKLQALFGSTVTLPQAVMTLTYSAGTGQGGALNNIDGVVWVDADFADPRITVSLFCTELGETGMAIQGIGWGLDGAAKTEAMSHVIGEQIYPGIPQNAGYVYAYAYLNNTTRPDIASTNLGVNDGQGYYPNVGGSILFIYWMKSLGKTVAQILQAGGTTLAQIYQNLGLGQATNAFAAFTSAVNARWPVSGAGTYNFNNNDLWTSTTAPAPGSPPAPAAAPPSTPQGTVYLSVDNGTPIAATLDATGSASWSPGVTGAHQFQVTYPGYGGFAPAPAATQSGTLTGGSSTTVNSVNFETGDFSQCFSQQGAVVENNVALWAKYSARIQRNNNVGNIVVAASATTTYSLPTAWYRFYFLFSQKALSGDTAVCGFQDTALNGKCFLHLNSNGNLLFQDSTGATLATGTTKLVAGTLYMISAKIGTGTTGAAWEIRIGGAVEISGTGNLGAGNNGSIKLGGNSSSYTDTFYYDEIAIDSAQYPAAISPPVAGNPFGTVTLSMDGTQIGSQALSAQGTAIFTIVNPAAGTHALVINFTSLGFQPQTQNATLVVSGGTGGIRTTSTVDNLGVSDVLTKKLVWGRGGLPLTNVVGITDIITTLQLSPKAPIVRDNLALSDQFARFVQHYRTVIDNLGVTDLATFLRIVFEQYSPDFVALTDVVKAILGQTARKITVSDNLAVTDVPATFKQSARIIANFPDSLGLSDTEARKVQAYRLVRDTLGLTDSPTLLRSGGRNVGDNVGLTDLITTFVPGHPLFVDSLGLSDAFARVATSYRQFSDNIGVSDAVNIGVGALLGITAYWRVDTPLGRWRVGNPVVGQSWSIVAGEDKNIIVVPDLGPQNITGWTLRWQLRAQDGPVPNLITIDTFNGLLVLPDTLNGLMQINLRSWQTVSLTYQPIFYWELARLDAGFHGSLARGTLQIALANAAA